VGSGSFKLAKAIFFMLGNLLLSADLKIFFFFKYVDPLAFAQACDEELVECLIMPYHQ
jgi:hypothetical protein